MLIKNKKIAIVSGGPGGFLMPPYASEGVNMAMPDALELSVCLTSDEFPDLKSTIAQYEKQMRTRATEVAKMTLDSTEMLRSVDPITNLINMFGDFGMPTGNTNQKCDISYACAAGRRALCL